MSVMSETLAMMQLKNLFEEDHSLTLGSIHPLLSFFHCPQYCWRGSSVVRDVRAVHIVVKLNFQIFDIFDLVSAYCQSLQLIY